MPQHPFQPAPPQTIADRLQQIQSLCADIWADTRLVREKLTGERIPEPARDVPFGAEAILSETVEVLQRIKVDTTQFVAQVGSIPTPPHSPMPVGTSGGYRQ